MDMGIFWWQYRLVARPLVAFLWSNSSAGEQRPYKAKLTSVVSLGNVTSLQDVLEEFDSLTEDQ